MPDSIEKDEKGKSAEGKSVEAISWLYGE